MISGPFSSPEIAARHAGFRLAVLRVAGDAAGMPVSAFVFRRACQAAEHIFIAQQPGASTTEVESLPTFTKPKHSMLLQGMLMQLPEQLPPKITTSNVHRLVTAPAAM